MKDSIKEGNYLVMQELYEAFNYFYSGNKAIGLLETKERSARKHYIKQDLGHKFMYNCKNYGIKFNKIFDLVFRCEIIRYVIKDNNEIVKANLVFTYDFMHDKLIEYESLYTPYSTLTKKEDVKVLFK